MKALAYTLYVVSVLLISGLARANAATPDSTQALYQTPVKISKIEAVEGKMNLVFSGNLGNPCYGQPAVAMVQDQNSPNVLTIHLSSSLPTKDACIDKIQSFLTTVELPMLVKASQITIQTAAHYVIRTEGYPFEVQVSGADLLQ